MLKKSSLRLLLASSLILLSSCSDRAANQPTEIRIVDLNGNPKPIRRMVPEGNAQILASQREEVGKNDIATINDTSPQANNPEPINNNAFQNYQKPTPEQSGSDLASLNNGKAPENKLEAAVSYDMSNAKNPEIKIEPTPTETNPQAATSTSNKKFKLAISKVKAESTESKVTKTSSGKSNILIQIGSFSSQENANKALAQSKKISAGSIEEVDLNGKKNYRVFLGPASNQKKAHTILKNAKNSGYKDAFIVK